MHRGLCTGLVRTTRAAGRRAVALGLAGAMAATMAAARAADDAARYRVALTAPATLALPAGAPQGGDFYRAPGGAWKALETRREADRPVVFALTPGQCSAAGTVDVLLGRPEWMALEDAQPPRVTGLSVDGTPRAVEGAALALGTLPGSGAVIDLALADDANPLSAEALRLHLTPAPGAALQVETAIAAPPGRTGRIVLRLKDLPPGAYRGELRLSDRAAAVNEAVYSLSFEVFGIGVSADRQEISLVGAGADYRFRPDQERQLLLPGDIWAKLTTRHGSTWLYPREFTAVEVRRDRPGEQTAVVTASAKGLDGKAVEGLGELQFELTVRADSPALLVTSRSVNRAAAAAEMNASWGWLPAPYYVTPAGRQEWSGKAKNTYVDVGRCGWIWLAPSRQDGPGLAWLSPMKFGESRFDTMLLYSESTSCATGTGVEIRFAIAPAGDAETAARLQADAIARGDLPAPATAPAAAAPR